MLSPGHSPVWELQPAQDPTQESHHCLRHISKGAWAHSLQIHSQKLFQSSANAESAAAMRQSPHTAPLPTGLGRALKKSWCFTCCHSEHTWQLSPDWAEYVRPRVVTRGFSGAACAPPHRVKGEQHAQGSQLCPKPQGRSTPGRREGLTISTGQEQWPLWAVLGRNRQRNAGLGFIFI